MGSTEELLVLPPPPKCVFEREWAPSLPSLGGRAGAPHRRPQKPPPLLDEEEEEERQQDQQDERDSSAEPITDDYKKMGTLFGFVKGTTAIIETS
ncbi:uncharacterized protein FAM241A isoform X2 [Varanus komodoensis]|uniref:uncharacterized protein FAM241A isoform X2 n=1 Tax=Varanus komodoensis TaxID=61221 RepID=UPI001CF77DDF|nr:uncharacterized protein FAM241A isoform X2 [Varanus komodoensis]